LSSQGGLASGLPANAENCGDLRPPDAGFGQPIDLPRDRLLELVAPFDESMQLVDRGDGGWDRP
jgi:hypothetical protein